MQGDPDWGKVEVVDGTPIYSEVVDTGDTSSKTFTLTRDKYEAGSGSVTISIRGSATSFTRFAGTPTWTEYTAPTNQPWRYVQAKMEFVA